MSKKNFLSFVAAVLCVCLGISCFAGFGLNKVSADDTWVNAYDLSDVKSCNGVNAVRVCALGDFTAISLCCGTWGGTVSHTAAVYEWAGDYASTAAGTAMAVADVGTGADNSFLEGTFKDPTSGADKTIPAGDYLIMFESSNEGTTSWLLKTASGSSVKQEAYSNGSVATYELLFKLKFTETLTKYFGNVAGSWVNAYTASGESSCNTVNAVRICALGDFTKISLQCGTWGGTVTHTATLYAWAGDYASSVAGTAIAVADVGTGGDNTYLTGEFKNPTSGAKMTVPAGDYLIMFESSNSGTTSYLIKTSTVSSAYQQTFANGGEVSYELHFKLNFAGMATQFFGKVKGETVNAFDLSGTKSWNAPNAARVKTLAGTTAITLQCGTWGGTVSHTATAYVWDGDYATTVAGTPVAVADIPAGADNTFLTGSFKNPTTGSTMTLPAGEYVFVFASSKGATAYLLATNDGDGSSTLQKAYANGAEQKFQFNMKLTFVGTATEFFGAISVITPFNFYQSGDHGALYITGDAAAQFCATESFKSIRIVTPTWGGGVKKIQLELFKWDTNYATTVAGTPVASYLHDFKGEMGDPTLTFGFDKQDAGEYVLRISNVEGNDNGRCYVWNIHEHFAAQRVYQDGAAVSDRQIEFSVNYLSAPASMYGPLSENVETKIDYAQPILTDSIAMEYGATVLEDAESVQMKFTFLGNETVVDGIEDEKNHYTFTLPGILPQQMGENIKAELIVDGEIADTVDEYSIKTYCMNQLEKAEGNLRTLLITMLNYGAAAQVYFDGAADGLVNEDITDVFSSFDISAAEGYVASPLSGTVNDSYKFKSAAIGLFDQISIRFKFAASDLTDLTVEIGDTVYTAEDFVSAGKGVYCVEYADILACDYAEEVSAVMKVDGVQVGQTVTYSVNTYLKNKAGSDTLGNIVQAVYDYGYAAAAYVA